MIINILSDFQKTFALVVEIEKTEKRAFPGVFNFVVRAPKHSTKPSVFCLTNFSKYKKVQGDLDTGNPPTKIVKKKISFIIQENLHKWHFLHLPSSSTYEASNANSIFRIMFIN